MGIRADLGVSGRSSCFDCSLANASGNGLPRGSYRSSQARGMAELCRTAVRVYGDDRTGPMDVARTRNRDGRGTEVRPVHDGPFSLFSGNNSGTRQDFYQSLDRCRGRHVAIRILSIRDRLLSLPFHAEPGR